MFMISRLKYLKLCRQLCNGGINSVGVGDLLGGCLLHVLKHGKSDTINHHNTKQKVYKRFYCITASASVNQLNDGVNECERDVPLIHLPSNAFLSKLDENSQNLCSTFQLEMQNVRMRNSFMPCQITDEIWSDILGCPSRSQREKIYKYLCIRARRIQEKKEDQAQRQSQLAEYRKLRKEKAIPFDGLEYGISKNCIFPRFTAQCVNQIVNSRLCQAIMFGEKLILDMSYTDYMVKMEYKNCAKQISKVIGYNKLSRQPFHLHFCNLARDTGFHEALKNMLPNLYQSTCMVTATEMSYLDIFPKEKLIYLTPHCENDMVDYDFDSIYIVGAFVDLRSTGQISPAKAKREGLRMARLPLDHFLNWGHGKKTLTLYAMLRILSEVKDSGDWNKAFSYIPHKNLIKQINSPSQLLDS